MSTRKGITVLVPTIGRDSLWACLFSVAGQLEAGDAVVVVSDGRSDDVRALVRHFSYNYPRPDWTYAGIDQQGIWGHPAANYALSNNMVPTSHVWRLDDDDIAAPGVMPAMRAFLDRPWTVFRMKFGEGHPANGLVCWRQEELRFGDVGTPMILAQAGNARFGLRYEGDWDYAQDLLEEFGEPTWNDQIVALIRPDGSLAE